MKTRTVILSIKPEYWDLIGAGKKIVEFRRKWIKKNIEIDKIYFYVSAPVQKIVGFATGIHWRHDALELIWRMEGKGGGISKETFDQYFHGVTNGNAIWWEHLVRFETTYKPSQRWSWWNRPPQNFMYVREDHL